MMNNVTRCDLNLMKLLLPWCTKRGPATYQMLKICDHVLLTKQLFYINIRMCEILSKVLQLITEKCVCVCGVFLMRWYHFDTLI